MLFHEAEQNKTYTVKRIKNRSAAKALEEQGIAVGSDIVIQPGDSTVQLVNGRTVTLEPSAAEALVLEEPRLRRASDPVFLGGCCAYGNTAAVWDTYINGEAPGEK